jgi:hypothetical protein
MFRLLSLLFCLAIACSAARPTDFSADMVMLDGARTMETLKLYVSGQKSRIEGMTAGQLGRIVAISRKDRGVTWTLYLDKNQYVETSVAAGGRPGVGDLSGFDLGSLKKEILGRETLFGHACTKMRFSMGNLPNGQPMMATAWVADDLELPLRLETMGMTQENRNLRVGPQPASLFELPAGYTKMTSPGMPAGMMPPAATGAAGTITTARPTATADTVTATRPPRRYDDKKATVSSKTASTAGPAWKLNTNYFGGDYRSIDMATSDPTACKAACDQDAPCKAWTLVKPGEPGGMGYCWLKNSVPEATAEDCCISGLKRATATATAAVGAQSQASQSQLEMNINRGGYDYRDFIPAKADPVLCAQACAKESNCVAWTWVKNGPEPPTGHCWLKDTVPEPGPDDCCVSGVKK